MHFHCFAVVIVALASCVFSHAELAEYVRPVIGILSLPISADQDDINFSRIDASYVRWLEGAGAMTVPIFFNETAENVEAQFHKLSGVFFTGGPNKPTDFDRYFSTATLLYNLALRYNQPLWGTCLGFQTISDIAAGRDILSDFEGEDLELPLVFTPAASTSKLFANAPPEIMEIFRTKNITTNWHHYGVSPEDFSQTLVPAGLIALSINDDSNGAPFVSMLEHSSAPIYAAQYHPEANAHDREHDTVNHSMEAVRAMAYLSQFFVQEARLKGLGPGDVGSIDVKCNGCDMETYPTAWLPRSHSIKYLFNDH